MITGLGSGLSSPAAVAAAMTTRDSHTTSAHLMLILATLSRTMTDRSSPRCRFVAIYGDNVCFASCSARSVCEHKWTVRARKFIAWPGKPLLDACTIFFTIIYYSVTYCVKCVWFALSYQYTPLWLLLASWLACISSSPHPPETRECVTILVLSTCWIG